MQIDSFELQEQPIIPSLEDLRFRVVIRGTGLVPRAVPFEGAFGDISLAPLWALRPQMDGGGVIGLLTDLPPIDAELLIGYLGEPLVHTGLDGTVPG